MDLIEENLGIKILDLIEESLGVKIQKKLSRIQISAKTEVM